MYCNCFRDVLRELEAMGFKMRRGRPLGLPRGHTWWFVGAHPNGYICELYFRVGIVWGLLLGPRGEYSLDITAPLDEWGDVAAPVILEILERRQGS